MQDKELEKIDSKINDGTVTDEDLDVLTDYFIGFMEELQNEGTDVLPTDQCLKKANDTGT